MTRDLQKSAALQPLSSSFSSDFQLCKLHVTDKLQDVLRPGQWKEILIAKLSLALVKLLLEKSEESFKKIRRARQGENVFIQDFFGVSKGSPFSLISQTGLSPTEVSNQHWRGY